MHIFYIMFGVLCLFLIQYIMYKKNQLKRNLQYIKSRENRPDYKIEKLNMKLDELHNQMTDDAEFMRMMNNVALKIRKYMK